MSSRKRSEVIHVHDATFDIQCRLRYPCALTNAAVVDEDIDLAKSIDDLSVRGLVSIRHGDVERKNHVVIRSRTTQAHPLESLDPSGRKDDVGTLAGKSVRECFADTGRSAGNPDGLIRERHEVFSRLR